MNHYISDIEILNHDHLSYKTKKEYLFNNTDLSSRLLLLILITPILYVASMLWITSKLHLDSWLSAFLVIFFPIALGIIGIVFACFDYQKIVSVELKKDSHRKISMKVSNQIKEIIDARYVRCVIHCYPLYDRRGKYKPIILIALELVKSGEDLLDTEAWRIASVQCQNEYEARMEFDKFLQSYQEIIQWINLPVHKEQKIITHLKHWWN